MIARAKFQGYANCPDCTADQIRSQYGGIERAVSFLTEQLVAMGHDEGARGRF